MTILRLEITDFRNLNSAKWDFNPQGFNFIYGKNGSGKTSLLEAIYYLSLGRSFRTPLVNRVICNTADKFAIFAHILTCSQQGIPVGIEKNRNGETKMRILGTDVPSITELASLMPVQLITAHCHNLIDAPEYRRKYLDWGLFYYSKDFLRIWKQFDRALKQRNAALRDQLSPSQLEIWTNELVNYALYLNQMRLDYTQQLIPLLESTVGQLLDVKDLKISYQPGWDNEANYADILAQSVHKDRQFGYTTQGPHRADFKIIIDKFPAKDILSRGQQKLLVCGMLLAQGTLLQNSINKKPIYLVDDLPSELDSTSRSKLMSLLSQQETQVFITAVERETLEDFLSNQPVKMFHVEQKSGIDCEEEKIIENSVDCEEEKIIGTSAEI